MSFSDMMQGDNGNIKEVLGITSFTNYLAIYMIYHCVVVFWLYSKMALHNINNYIVDIFLFITAVISLLVTTLAISLLCKHKKLRMPVASLALQQEKEIGTVMQKEINTECNTLTYINLVLTVLA